MSKSILLISSYPPRRCGIASYATAHERKLREKGDKIERFSFQRDGETTYRFANDSILGLVCAIFFFWRHSYAQVYLHFTEELVWPKPHGGPMHPLIKILQFVMTYCLIRAYGSHLEIYMHEISNNLPPENPKRKLRSFLFSHVKSLIFHTEVERENFLRCYGENLRKRTEVVAHETNFEPAFLGTKAEARKQLSLREEDKIFLCIGFIAPHKGIEDAIAGFQQTVGENLKLIIAGSIRSESQETANYLDHLRKLVEADARIDLRYRYLDDMSFDQWLKACDYVILPYKEIWSSGVAARALTVGTSIIARSLPNLKSQMQDKHDVIFFEDASSLSRTISSLDR